MKIVQIVTQMEAGGAQRIAYLLHDALGRRGHDTELWFLYLKRPAYSGKPGVRVLANRRPSLLGYFLLATLTRRSRSACSNSSPLSAARTDRSMPFSASLR